MSQNTVAPITQGRTNPRRVFFNGTGALVQGQGLCYNADYGTAADPDERRNREVELPSQSNNNHFAGVTSRAYAANSLGQWVEIFEPGSVCPVSVLAGTTVNSTRLNCLVVGASGTNLVSGRWISDNGLTGRGSAVALQTVTAITSTTTTPGVIGSSVDGSATWTVATLTLTKSSAFTYAAAGDKIVVVGGLDTAASTTVCTPGEYIIASVTSANAVVLTTSMCSADAEVAYFHIRGNPTCLCRLLDGQESGCIEWLTPTTGAVTSTIGGRTVVFGGFALNTADSTFTLADGTFTGQYKSILLKAAITSNDYLVTLGTTGEQLDGSTDLGSLEFDGAGDDSLLIWGGSYWRLLVNKGTGLA